MNYYNDNDPFAAEFLRHLIAGKVIGAGYVDERSIDLVQPSDLEGFKQCHFFAGIGGWAYGNAINPRVAKIFIETFIEACGK